MFPPVTLEDQPSVAVRQEKRSISPSLVLLVLSLPVRPLLFYNFPCFLFLFTSEYKIC